MRIATLRRRASRVGTLLRTHAVLPRDNIWWNIIGGPLGTFVHELRRGLHEGIVKDHPEFWHAIVNKTIEIMADDARLVRMIVSHETLFAQVKFLTDETAVLASGSLRGYSRYALVRAFCEAFKLVNHPRL